MMLMEQRSCGKFFDLRRNIAVAVESSPLPQRFELDLPFVGPKAFRLMVLAKESVGPVRGVAVNIRFFVGYISNFFGLMV